MALCCQATSHCLSQCWPCSMSSYGVNRSQWVKASYGMSFYGHFMDIFFQSQFEFCWNNIVLYFLVNNLFHVVHSYIHITPRGGGGGYSLYEGYYICSVILTPFFRSLENLYSFDPCVLPKMKKMSYFDPYFSSKLGKMYSFALPFFTPVAFRVGGQCWTSLSETWPITPPLPLGHITYMSPLNICTTANHISSYNH